MSDQAPGLPAVAVQVKRYRGKGKRPPSVTEISTAMALADRGLSESKIARLLDRDKGTIARVLAEARDALDVSAGWYVDQHKIACAVAALKGDSRPAQWALERLAVVEPVQAADHSGLIVQIGVRLPGLGDG